MLPIKRGINTLREDGLMNFCYQTFNYLGFYTPIWNTYTSRYPIGTNIFEKEWDLLIILDTCRVDALQNQTGEAVGGSIEKIRSVGSMSPEWMLNTFTERYRNEIEATAFVSGNIWSHRIFNERFHEHRNHDYDMIHKGRPHWTPVDASDFAYYETVCPFKNQDRRVHPEAQHIPHIETDRAIHVARNEDWKRLVVHYTLPHLNHIAGALDWEGDGVKQSELMNGDIPIERNLYPEEKSVEPASNGEVSRETMHMNFEENLRLALEYVKILLKDVDAETAVISADHGEGLGNSTWSHPYGYPFSPVKNVPWMTTTATDEHTYESTYEALDRAPTESELKEHLKAMGYY